MSTENNNAEQNKINLNSQEEIIKKAKARVEELKGFYSHLWAYIFVNILLAVINFTTSPNELWFYFTTVFWGIGLLGHAFSTWGINSMLGSNWEDKKTQELVDKMSSGK